MVSWVFAPKEDLRIGEDDDDFKAFKTHGGVLVLDLNWVFKE